MKVAPNKPFRLVYSLYKHEYLGYLFESFIIELDEGGNLSLRFQNISAKNAEEFATGLTDDDYGIIEVLDTIQQDTIRKKFSDKKMSTVDFLLRVYDKEKGDKGMQQYIENHIESKKAKVIPLLVNRELYIMGRDGNPAWKPLRFANESADIEFFFRKEIGKTIYFPNISLFNEKVHITHNAKIIANDPAWVLFRDELLFNFSEKIEGNKLKVFLQNRYVEIPDRVEEQYYKKFIPQLVQNFKVNAEGFTINEVIEKPKMVLTFTEYANNGSLNIFDTTGTDDETDNSKSSYFNFELKALYGQFELQVGNADNITVVIGRTDEYVFNKIFRDLGAESKALSVLKDRNLNLIHGNKALDKYLALNWIFENREALATAEIEIRQSRNDKSNNEYFYGEMAISMQLNEERDWFDVKAIVTFGEFKIPFVKLRHLILAGKTEFPLPDGRIAVIPREWLVRYSELIQFSDSDTDSDKVVLDKMYFALVHQLGDESHAEVVMSRKLEKLRSVDAIEPYPMPIGFIGQLRPYQKAGYDWMMFLNQMGFGGCLADDMGLGKTVQMLTVLQKRKEENAGASLLVVPTSLLYNWEQEAKKFTPQLAIYNHTGANRTREPETFAHYNLIITSYGTLRMDAEMLASFYFDYIILDESQAIKNPTSNVSKAANMLKSRHKMVLTGTPIENSVLDLWSQMNFINAKLLGTQSQFKKSFINAIEKKNDEEKIKKLHTVVAPFILRRQKSQVATELPPKIEHVQYCEMMPEQAKLYEETKSSIRNQILDSIETEGVNKSQIKILQGLTLLRQIANHPAMVNPDYQGSSGKLEDVAYKIYSLVEEGHKVLIFSQFVKHLTLLRTELDALHFDYCYLDGSTTNRQQQVESFQNDEKKRVFLISLKAGGVGLNLIAADYVFILDPWWNPAAEQQAVDRAHRIGQDKHVFIYKFITQKTVEEKILALQQQKRKLASDIIVTDESFMKDLTGNDVEMLFS